jgi:lipid-A-disaccharide synthase-like uncharacterized protein
VDPTGEGTFVATLVWAVGWGGAVIFYSRFYVQWIVSEIRKRSVVPIAFWYMSGIGSMMLLVYNVYTRQPGATFGQSFNMAVYGRNLVHIWRERGVLTARRNVAIHAITMMVVIVGIACTAHTWMREYAHNAGIPKEEAVRNWFWLGVWAVGQALFFARFAIQWAVTEISKRSVIPPVFWHISAVAALLQTASFAQRGDWPNTIGTAATILVYARNIWFVHFRGDGPQEG